MSPEFTDPETYNEMVDEIEGNMKDLKNQVEEEIQKFMNAEEPEESAEFDFRDQFQNLMHRGGHKDKKYGDKKHGDRTHVDKKHKYSKYEDAYYKNDYAPNVWDKFAEISEIVEKMTRDYKEYGNYKQEDMDKLNQVIKELNPEDVKNIICKVFDICLWIGMFFGIGVMFAW